MFEVKLLLQQRLAILFAEKHTAILRIASPCRRRSAGNITMAPNANQTASDDEEVTTQMEVYTVFRKWEKVYIVSLITFAACFSTFSSFIYYPVITFVARDLRTTVANVNLTVTAYMVVSGIAPALIGDLADRAGRRPTYVMTLLLYFCANIGIAVQDSFVALLLLRMLQSAGISSNDILAY